MKSNKILNYILWLPFAISIGALVLFLRYFIMFKLDSNLIMTKDVKETLNGYLIIVFVSLFVGLLIVFFKKIFALVNTDKKKDKDNILPSNNWSSNISNDKKVINYVENNSKGITNESNFIKYAKANNVIKVKLSDPVTWPKLKGKVFDTDEDIEILLLDDDIDYNVIDSIKCPKCNKIVNKDAFICTNCGVLLNENLLSDVISNFKETKKEEEIIKVEEQPKKKFNFVLFLVNFMIIILCIFLIFLIGNKIVNQRDKNYSNMNIINETYRE